MRDPNDTKDLGHAPEAGNGVDMRIMKTTQFSIQYDAAGERTEREMEYKRLGLKPVREWMGLVPGRM